MSSNDFTAQRPKRRAILSGILGGTLSVAPALGLMIGILGGSGTAKAERTGTQSSPQPTKNKTKKKTRRYSVNEFANLRSSGLSFLTKDVLDKKGPQNIIIISGFSARFSKTILNAATGLGQRPTIQRWVKEMSKIKSAKDRRQYLRKEGYKLSGLIGKLHESMVAAEVKKLGKAVIAEAAARSSAASRSQWLKSNWSRQIKEGQKK